MAAGRFYDAEGAPLAAVTDRLCAAEDLAALPDRLVGGVVPHAGWVCSGRVAGLVWRALAGRGGAKTIFLTGSVHTCELEQPALDTAEAWATPLGPVAVDQKLREAIAQLEGFGVDDRAHVYEHSLEVNLPMVRHCFGEGVRFVPCMIPPSPRAAAWGEALGTLLARWPEPVLVVASSDLTHYGPNYGFMPAGPGEAGYRWAHGENDRRLLERVADLDAAGAVADALEHHSACGGGAIAAVLAAARRLGAEAGHLLDHTDSVRELSRGGYYIDRTNSVGYAAVVLG